ncbi:site-specific integrase [Rhodocytophaga rosea]|uniref:Site-specific integrase n=1 Tax=Rhodocytophaga rosea TaxID=2704465 RepID=A0A6C0GHM0_9BACT|nr:site-specific integrase [Rhodocytophaga rosea]QHT67395.1 site-specific integrase [Rhodocytophaga rosea]
MSIVNFYLRNLKKGLKPTHTPEEKKAIEEFNKSLANKETFIELRFRYNKTNLLIYNTEIKILSKLWNPAKQRIKSQASRQTDNLRLDALEKQIMEIYSGFRLKSIIPTLTQLREALEGLTKKQVITAKSFFQCFEKDFIEARSKHAVYKERVTGSTVAKYKICIKHLKDFEKAKRFSIAFDNLDKNFYNRLCQYLSTEYTYKKGKLMQKGLEDNTVGNTVKFLKTFMDWSYKKGLHQNVAYKEFKTLKFEDDTIITLNSDELTKITSLDLLKNEKLDRVRDIFLFGVEIGARVSDLLKLKAENVLIEEGNYFIKYIAKKTIKHSTKHLIIPIRAEKVAIIKKYEGKYATLLPTISDQKFNEYIKELCQLAGINNYMDVYKMIAGEKTFIGRLPKYELISSHVMRRTFITEALKNGLPAELVMECSGHKDFKSFARYINFTDKNYKMKMFDKVWNGSSIRIAS